MAVTIQEIADKLHVSASTVSRSLRNDPLIHPATRARIHQTAIAIGYQGRARRGRTPAKADAFDSETAIIHPPKRSTIAVLLGATDMQDARRKGNFIRMLEGITAECDRMGALNSLHNITTTTDDAVTAAKHPLPPIISEGLCNAVIVAGPARSEDVAAIARLYPVVTLSRVFSGVASDAVLADNVRGTASLVARLASLGHRKLVFVPNSRISTFDEDRYAGFVSGCVKSNLDLAMQARITEDRLIMPDGSPDSDAVLKLIMDRGVTALVAANDEVAVRLITALERLGLAVPDVLSVTGFDYDDSAAYLMRSTGRSLTTIDPNFNEMGRCAVRMVLQRLEYSAVPALQLSVTGTLINGETIAPPRGAI
ncbi:MAG: LacI family DNA-binding transcriptional regulator [Capsulimonadaceae bacterium]|nr:LacI family DNA-binding transcriptional regulator [Capsulimonadaceae bacterium]